MNNYTTLGLYSRKGVKLLSHERRSQIDFVTSYVR